MQLDDSSVTVIRIPSKGVDGLVRVWLEMLKPLTHLRDVEADVATCYICEYFRLRQHITDEALLWEMMWSRECRQRMMKKAGKKLEHFQSILTMLRQKKFIIDGRINRKFIPNIAGKQSNMVLHFEL